MDMHDDHEVRVLAARAALCATDRDGRHEVLREVFESDCCLACFIGAVLDLVATIASDANIAALETHLLALLDGVEPSQ